MIRNNTHQSDWTLVTLEHKDISFLKNLYGKNLQQCLTKALIIPMFSFLLFVSISLLIFVLNLFSSQPTPIKDVIFFLPLLLCLSFMLYPFIVYPIIMDFLHAKKTIVEQKKWRVIGTAADYDIHTSLSEYGWNEKTMTFRGTGKRVSFELFDKEQDYVVTGGAFQIDFVYDRYHRAIELSRKTVS